MQPRWARRAERAALADAICPPAPRPRAAAARPAWDYVLPFAARAQALAQAPCLEALARAGRAKRVGSVEYRERELSARTT
jgi:hypothetical protein